MDARGQVVDELVRFLTERGYDPGERIPSERDLTERFGASRGSIREALAFLGALGVIERREKSGVYMASEPASGEALALLARIGVPLAPEQISQSMELRHILEPAAVRLACERGDEESFATIHGILNEAGDGVTRSSQEMADLDRRFHTEIVRSTGNDLFYRLVNIYYLMTARIREEYFDDPDRWQHSHAEHVELFDAVRAGDSARAGALMSAHLSGVDSHWQRLLAGERAKVG